jgi:PAS domain S-box-containing protein
LNVSKNLRLLQQQLLLLLGALLLIIEAGVSYFVFLVKPEVWLLTGGGLLLLSLIILWGAAYILKQHLSQISQLEPDRSDQNQPDPITEVDEEELNNSIDTQKHLTILKVEENVGQIEANFRQLVELSPYGIIIHDESQTIFINIAGAKLLGAAGPEELLGKSIMDLIHPNYREKIRSRIRQILLVNKQAPVIEEKFVRLNGQDIDIEMVGLPFVYQNKPAAQLIIHDISARKAAEAKLVKRNRELTSLQSAAIAISSRLDLRYVLDTIVEEMTKLLNIEQCIISEWNQKENTVVKVAEYHVDAGWWDASSLAKVYPLANYPLTKLVLEDQIPEQMTSGQPNIDPFEQAYMQEHGLKTLMILPMVFQRRVMGLVELQDRRLERTFTYAEISLAKLLSNQAANALENAHLFEQARQEIIERKRAESAVKEERALLAQRVRERTEELSKANAELARAARLKDEFLAGVSHELRTPLNTIIGSAEILRTQTFGPLNQKQIKFLHNSEESGHHLLSLINDILDLSKAEAGKLEVDIEMVSVKSICESSLRLVKELAHQKQLNVSIRLDNKVTKVEADVRRLKQILVNLLSNAIKFTPEGGRIGFEVTGDSLQQAVHFTVWDTGIGIPQEDMKLLFQPFVQLDSRLTREYEGTGLGLSLVSRMVELHNGSVSVESEIDQGSRFTVSLPWPDKVMDLTEPQDDSTEKQTVSAPQTVPHSFRGDQPLVLLADDNEDNINTFLEYLEFQGYRVITARNGHETIERVKEERPDVILMDIQMPGMDGLEATRRIRADTTLPQIPVIALTALTMPGDRERCLEAGANEYLSKPVSPRTLIKTINTYLN